VCVRVCVCKHVWDIELYSKYGM